jgi:hypothetical protein
MSTRAVIRVFNEGKEVIANIYKHWDGYPSALGVDLADFLSDFTLVNGLGAGQSSKVANGMGCLAAQLIAHLKTAPGDVYLLPLVRPGSMGEEYLYTVSRGEAGKLHLTVREVGRRKILSEGTPETFLTFWRR